MIRRVLIAFAVLGVALVVLGADNRVLSGAARKLHSKLHCERAFGNGFSRRLMNVLGVPWALAPISAAIVPPATVPLKCLTVFHHALQLGLSRLL